MRNGWSWTWAVLLGLAASSGAGSCSRGPGGPPTDSSLGSGGQAGSSGGGGGAGDGSAGASAGADGSDAGAVQAVAPQLEPIPGQSAGSISPTTGVPSVEVPRAAMLDAFYEVVADGLGHVILHAGSTVAKLDASLHQLWSVSGLSTSGSDAVVDDSGAIYLAGSISDNDGSMAAIQQINADGTLGWLRTAGSMALGDLLSLSSVALGPDGTIYVVGSGIGQLPGLSLETKGRGFDLVYRKDGNLLSAARTDEIGSPMSVRVDGANRLLVVDGQPLDALAVPVLRGVDRDLKRLWGFSPAKESSYLLLQHIDLTAMTTDRSRLYAFSRGALAGSGYPTNTFFLEEVNPATGAVAWTRQFSDSTAPVSGGTWKGSLVYFLSRAALIATNDAIYFSGQYRNEYTAQIPAFDALFILKLDLMGSPQWFRQYVSDPTYDSLTMPVSIAVNENKLVVVAQTKMSRAVIFQVDTADGDVVAP